jgi:4-hydroxy-4-methyl-2-oxoglutarate aldolase
MDRKELLELYEPLRVADVRDGMDWNMLHYKGSVSPDIKTLWRGAKMVGFARTVQYLPSNQQVGGMTPDEYTRWAREYWYGPGGMTDDGLKEDLEDGDIVVVDASDVDVGLVGSNNTLHWTTLGARGVLTNGGVRDTDEVELQRIPVFSRYISQTMTQGRVEFAHKDLPVDIGGQVVRPGDIIVGDGDGVIVVPIEHAESVAKYAHQELENDKQGRRRFYEQLGRPLDDTVQ